MAAPYDYVQIVTDDDWGLVGIIPNNGTESPNANPFVNINTNQNFSVSKLSFETKFQDRSGIERKIPAEKQGIPQVSRIRSLPEATVVNRRRPNNYIAKKVEDPPITRAESTNYNSLYGRNVNPNILNGMAALESSLSTSIRGGSQYQMDNSDLLLFGEISNLAGAGNRDNILVGFG